MSICVNFTSAPSPSGGAAIGGFVAAADFNSLQLLEKIKSVFGVSEPYTLAMLKEVEILGLPGSFENFKERQAYHHMTSGAYNPLGYVGVLRSSAKDTLEWAYSGISKDGLWDEKIPAHQASIEKEIEEKQKAAAVAHVAREEATRKAAESAAAKVDADMAGKDWIVKAEAMTRLNISYCCNCYNSAECCVGCGMFRHVVAVKSKAPRIGGPLFEAAVAGKIEEITAKKAEAKKRKAAEVVVAKARAEEARIQAEVERRLKAALDEAEIQRRLTMALESPDTLTLRVAQRCNELAGLF